MGRHQIDLHRKKVNSTEPSRGVFVLSCFWYLKVRLPSDIQIGRSGVSGLRRTNREFLFPRFPELFVSTLGVDTKKEGSDQARAKSSLDEITFSKKWEFLTRPRPGPGSGSFQEV